MRTDYQDVPILEVKFAVEELCIQFGVPRQNLIARTELDYDTDMVMFQIKRLIATLPGEETLTVPATSWDHFKSLLPKWLQQFKIFTPKMKTYEAKLYLPSLPLPDKKEFALQICNFHEMKMRP